MYIKQIVAATRKNKSLYKPNEDYYRVSETLQMYVVADGVTRGKADANYPNPSPASEVSQMLCAETMIIGDEQKLISLQDLFVKANQQIGKYNKDYDGYFKPGTVGVGVRIREDILEYVSIGDCPGLLLRDGLIQRFNTNQTASIMLHAKSFTKEIIRRDICNNTEHPYGFGVLNGDKNAEAFIECGILKIREGDKIMLMSDGLDSLLKDSQMLHSLIQNTEQVFDFVEFEDKRLGIRSDDKTLIALEVIGRK